MNKDQFLETLERLLGKMSLEEKKDILYDYEEHINLGLEVGNSEEEIIKSLGDPSQIAKLYKANYYINRAEQSHTTGNILKAVSAALGLGFLNIVFVLGPFIATYCLYIGLIASACGLVIGGIAFIISIFISPVLPQSLHVPLNPGVIFFVSLSIIALGFLLLIGCFYLGKILYKVTISYLKMNMKIIKNGG